jgi:hypothetical protein
LLSSVSFVAVKSYPLFTTGYSGSSIAAADFNGDGKLDVAAVTDNELTIAYGNGDGTFQSPVVISHNVSGDFILAADINGDGLPDIVTDSYNSSTNTTAIEVFLNNGNGTFNKVQVCTINNHATSATVADFNGNADLLITTEYSDESGNHFPLDLALGNSSGSFTTTTIENGNAVNATYSVAVGKFNGDSNDIAIANSESTVVDVFLGNGDGTFGPTAKTFTTTFDPSSIVAANIDSNEDLVLGEASAKQIQIVPGNGDGTFKMSANQSFSTAYQFSSIAVTDINGDSRPDIVAFYAGGTVSIPNQADTPIDYYGAASTFLGNSDGTFHTSPGQTFFDGNSGGGSDSIVVAALNGDGNMDVMTAGSGKLFVTLGNGDGTFASEREFYSYSGIDTLAVTNFNGSSQFGIVAAGDDDLDSASFAGSSPRSNSANILLADSNGALGFPQVFSNVDDLETVVDGDFNGDGQMDIAVVGSSADSIDSSELTVFMLHNSSGTLTVEQTDELGAGHVDGAIDGRPSIAAADFNGDGYDDIVSIYKNTTGYSLAVFINKGNSSGTFNLPKLYYTGTYAPYAVAVGDFNGDGKEDIAAISHSHVSVFLGNGDGSFNSSQIVSNIDAISQSSIVIAADLQSGVSKTDLVIGGGGGAVQVLLANSGGHFYPPAVVQSGSTFGLAVANLNGDDCPDILTDYTGDDNIGVLLGNGNGTFQNPQTIATLDFSPDSIVAADINGDGKQDIIVGGYNGNSSQISVLLNTTKALPSYITPSANADYSWDPATGDLTLTSGTLTFTADSATDTTDPRPNLTAIGSNSAVYFDTSQHLAGLTLEDGAYAKVVSLGAARTHSNHNVLVIGTLGSANDPTFIIDSTSKLDMTDNDLIVHTGSSDANGYTELAAVQGLVRVGRDNGAWDGLGLTSSAAANQENIDGSETTQLAVVLNNDLPNTLSAWTVGSFSESLNANDIIVKYTYTGDFTLAGSVTQIDNTIFVGNYGNGSTGLEWADGDTNGDGILTQLDNTSFVADFGNGTPDGNDTTLL